MSHTTTVTPVGPETLYKDGPYRIDCTCGEHVTYAGYYFTIVEADRHRRYHERNAA